MFKIFVTFSFWSNAIEKTAKSYILSHSFLVFIFISAMVYTYMMMMMMTEETGDTNITYGLNRATD